MATQRYKPADMSGTIYSDFTGHSDQEVRQVVGKISQVLAEKTKLYALLAGQNGGGLVFKSGGQVGVANKYEWQRQYPAGKFVTLAADLAAGATSATIVEANAIVAGATLLNVADGSRELIRVTANVSGALTLDTRGALGGTPVALSSGYQLVIAANTVEDFGLALDSTSTFPVFDFNFFQDTEEDFSTSERVEGVNLYMEGGGHGGMMTYQEREALDRMKSKIEKSLLFNPEARVITTANNRQLWVTKGLDGFIRDGGSRYTIGGQAAFTEAEFTDFMTEHARLKNGLYWLFSCGKIGNIMRNWAKTTQRADYMGTTERYGLTHSRFQGSNWQADHFQLEALEDNDELRGRLYIVEPKGISMVMRSNGGFYRHPEIVSPRKDGTHGFKTQIGQSFGLQVEVPEHNGLIEGIQS